MDEEGSKEEQIEDFSEINVVEKFLMKEFARSIEEWVLEYNELLMDTLIATGSTCQVYKGLYRNMTVAIKKLLTQENENKIKFLKEFKRELSLLISLPNHSNLLSLVGFCIRKHDVYLVTEYCASGTLFDILYKKTLGFSLSALAKQKATDKDPARRLPRHAVPPRAQAPDHPPRPQEPEVPSQASSSTARSTRATSSSSPKSPTSASPAPSRT